MKLKVTAGRPKVDLDNGTYPMTIVDIQEAVIENPQYGDGNVIRIEMSLDGLIMEDGEPVILDTIANPKLSPKSKLGGWCKALGFDLSIGDEFDLDELKGAKGLAVVENDIRDGQEWPRVVNIVGAPKTGNNSQAGPLDVSGFWIEAYKLGDRDIIFAKVKSLTGGKMLAGLDGDGLAALLKKLRPRETRCKHPNAGFTEEGVMVCPTCGLKGEELEKELGV